MAEFTSVWEGCEIARCFIVDNENKGEKEEYIGVWKKSLSFYIEMKEMTHDKLKNINEIKAACKTSIDAQERKGNDEKISSEHFANKPLIFITHHDKYYGMWSFSSAQDNCFLCDVKHYKTDVWQPNLYAIDYIPSKKNDEFFEKFCITSPDEKKSPTVEDPSKVFIAPPLKFYVRSTVFSLDDIQTANQTFRTSIFIELRLRSICTEVYLVKFLMQGINILLYSSSLSFIHICF